MEKKYLAKKLFKHKSFLIGFVILSFFCLIALLGPLFISHNPNTVFDGLNQLKPFWMQGSQAGFLLGTDDLGRDLLSRLIYGARVSLFVGFLVVLLSGSVGGALGILAGFYEGRIDRLIMRFVDMLMSVPSILLAIVVVSILGPSLWVGITAVSIVSLPGFIRVMRSTVLVEKNKDYVSAAQSFGTPVSRIVFKNILPNSLAPLIVQASLGFSDGILNVAALGFLGLGAQPPTAEWGAMLSDSRAYIESAPWLVTLPGLCILLVVISFNLLGDGLRDVLDPKIKV